MKCWERNQGKVGPDQYAAVEDFCSVFMKNMDRLYLLSLLLTGDHEKAEQTFVAGLEDSVEANTVFRHWAHSWAKRAIIQNAIRALQPRPGCTIAPSPVSARLQNSQLAKLDDFPFSRVLALEDFERFIFVMSVLERYSDHECALLLGCSLQEIQNARGQALQHIAAPIRSGSLATEERARKGHVAVH